MEQANLVGYNGTIPEELLAEETERPPFKDRPDLIKRGNIRLKFKHPLIETKITKVFPFLGTLRNCCRKITCQGEEEEEVKPKKSAEDAALKRQNTFYKT